MIGLIIFIILLVAFYEGARKGTALQGIYFIGFLISLLVANNFYQVVGEKIELYVPYLSVSPDTTLVFYSLEEAFDLGKIYYAGVAFIGLFAVGWLLTKFVGIFFSSFRFYEMFPYQWILAGMLNVIIVYTMLFMLLLLLTTIPIDFIQNLFRKSDAATFIVEKTPILSNLFQNLWMIDSIY